MSWLETKKNELILTIIVALVTSYWIVDLSLDSILDRSYALRLVFDSLFFVAQVFVIIFVWKILEKSRKLQEILIREREDAESEKTRTQSILSAIGEGISIQDRSFRIIYQNDVHKELVGKDCTGEICYQAYSAQDDVCHGCPVIETFCDGKTHLQEKKLVHSDTERFIEIFSSPMFDRDGQVVAGIEMVRDVTHRVLAEREILNLNKELHQRGDELSAANHDLESFNYSLSHDLRSPLSQITTAIDLLEQNIESHDLLTEQNVFFVSAIRDGSGRIDQMIQGMLDLVRSGQGKICRTEVDLSAMATRIIKELQATDSSRTVEVHIASGLTAYADPCLAHIVLLNLLGNAWKYTRLVRSPVIEVGSQTEKGTVNFFVRDNGAGFKQEFADRIFKPFQRLHDAQDFPGDGIGLSTVYQIIKKHGGGIQAHSEVQKGATFIFTFEQNKS